MNLKVKKILSGLVCSVMLMSSAATLAQADELVTLYAPNGQTIVLNESEVPAYQAVGWFLNLSDVQTTLYSYDGSTITVYNDEVASYVALGWSVTPVKIKVVTQCPVTFVDTVPDGTTYSMTFNAFEIKGFEYVADTDKIRIHYYLDYTNNGYPSLTMHCYDSYGVLTGDVAFNEFANYIDVPSNTVSFSITANNPADTASYVYRNQCDLYSLDGRSVTIYDIQTPIYTMVGWQIPTTLYAPDGREIQVAPYEVDAYKAVGWYTLEGYVYYLIETQYNEYMAAGDYNSALALILAYEGKFADTVYAYALSVFKSRAMDAWRAVGNSPLAVIQYETNNSGSTPTVAISFRNVSYKKIVAFKLNFDCYNSSGVKDNSKFDYYYCNDSDIDIAAAKTFLWTLTGTNDIQTIKNIKITEIVYEDDTRWYS